MQKKYKKFLLAVIILFSMMKTVYGATVDVYYTYYNFPYGERTNGNYRIRKNINGTVSHLDTIEIDNNSGYCVDVGANLQTGNIEKYSQSLEEYINTSLNNSATAKKISDKINEYAYFGNKYLTSEHGQNYYVASQLLIWEELYKNGYRQNAYSSNVSLTIDNGTSDDFDNEKTTIKNDIKKYYTTPSMCSNDTKLELAVGETATYKDRNNVLADYEVTCSEGLKCQKNGSDLKITVLSNEGTQTIKFNKDGAGTSATLYKSGTNQGVITDGKVGPVSCDFGIDTYKNAQTSGVKNVVIITIGLLFGLMSYLIYYKYQINTNE